MEPGHDGSSGFWEKLQSAPLPDEVLHLLPSASDRFHEALFFAKHAIERPAEKLLNNEVTWLVGAHLSAFISITDAARIDFANADRKFEGSTLDLEIKPGVRDDPVSANKAFRDLRNLRTHLAAPLVVLERRYLVQDLSPSGRTGDARPAARWYFKPVAWELVKRLKTPQLTEMEVVRFNSYLKDKAMVDVLGQMLLVVRDAMVRSATALGTTHSTRAPVNSKPEP